MTLDLGPLDVVAHNATVIVSGVLLGALLAFITFHGWLRHQATGATCLFSLHYRRGLL
jgi:hypothetical protein